MELIGDAAEERELTGNESLAELVDTFTEERAPNIRGMFQEVKDSFSETISQKQERIRDAVGTLRNEIPLPSQKRDIIAALNSLAADYFCLGMGLKYDRIAKQLFEIKRIIGTMVDGKEINLTIPLFADVVFGKSVWKLETSREDAYKRYNIEIESRAPPITKEVKDKARQVTADYMDICSKALRNNGISDLIFRDINSAARLDLRMRWIPSPSELRIEAERIDKDPILTASVYGRHYLVAAWNVRGEEPYQHYVQEFTEEKARR